MIRFLRRIAGFRDREEGSATVEMVILFPVFMVLFVSSFELGTVMLRQTMLDRSVDMTVRELRLNLVEFEPDPTLTPTQQLNVFHDLLRERVCDRSGFLANCATKLKLEMRIVDPRAFTGLDPDADCQDYESSTLPPTSLQTGAPNAMVVIRACHLFKPFIENFRLGVVLGEILPTDGAYYRIVSTASYVIEPS
jgi:hypothetical protein